MLEVFKRFGFWWLVSNARLRSIYYNVRFYFRKEDFHVKHRPITQDEFTRILGYVPAILKKTRD